MVKFANVMCSLSQGYTLSMHIFHPNTLSNDERSILGIITKIDPKTGIAELGPDGNPVTIDPEWWAKYSWWIASSLGSVILMTTLYNAMLIVAQQLSNPFNQDRLSFPGLYYEKGVEEDGSYFHEMAKRRPWDPQAFLPPIDEEEDEQGNSSENEDPVHA